MRVSELSKINLALKGLNDSAAKAQSINESISSGKRINRPSDDPLGASKLAMLKSEVAKADNYTKLLNLDNLWLSTIDSSTNRMIEILRYAKVKALEAANSFQSKESLAAIAAELEAIRQELFALGNSKVNNLYIYSGSKTFTAPLKEGWPFQLPEISGAQSLQKSTSPVDDWLIRNFMTSEEFDEETAETVLEFNSYLQLNEDNQDGEAKLLANKEGLYNINQEAYNYKVPITRNDTAQQIVDKLNLNLAKKYFFEESKTHPNSFKQDAYFYLGADHHIYLQHMPGVSIALQDSFKAFVSMAPVAEIPAEGLTQGSQKEGFFGEYAEGFTDRPLTVRVTGAGYPGEAYYSVSDDEGRTWSPKRLLGWQNEIYNPDGLTSTHVFLNFIKGENPKFLDENLEFRIKPNPAVIYQGNDQERVTPQDKGYKTKINISAGQLFFGKDQTTVNAFDILSRLQKNVTAGAISDIGKQLPEIDMSIDQVLRLRALAGIKVKNLEVAQERIEQSNLDASKAMSEIEDTDLAKAASDLNLNTIQRQSIMETTARIIQPSLVQFLR